MQTITLNDQLELLNEQQLNTLYGGTSEQKQEEYIIIYKDGKAYRIRINSDGSITILEEM